MAADAAPRLIDAPSLLLVTRLAEIELGIDPSCVSKVEDRLPAAPARVAGGAATERDGRPATSSAAQRGESPGEPPDHGVDEGRGRRMLDLARLLDLVGADLTEGARQCWVVPRGPRAYRIRAGDRAALQSTAELQIWALPPLLASLALRAAVSGLWLAGGRLGLLLDAERLTTLAATAGCEVVES